jgi:hypothetical protein
VVLWRAGTSSIPSAVSQYTLGVDTRLLLIVALCVGSPAALAAPPKERGITLRAYALERAPERLPVLAPGQTPNVDVLLSALSLRSPDALPELPAPFVARASGWIELADDARVMFRLRSDDGARLVIDDRLVIDHDGRHGATAKESAAIPLLRGLRSIQVDWFDAGGQRALVVEWKREGDAEYRILDEQTLRAEADLARVTSPGPKRIADGGRAGDGRAVEGVHPALAVESLAPPGFLAKVGALAALPDGRILVGTFDPLQRDEERLPDIDAKEPDAIWAVVRDASGMPVATRVIEDVHEPCGIAVVGDDVYVSHRLAISRFRDLDADGRYESRHDVASGWEGWNYHQFTFGLVHVPARAGAGEAGGKGFLYAALSTAMAPPAWEGMGTNAGPNGVGRGGIIEVDLDAEDWRIIAGGCRTPDGIGVGPEGTLLVTENQGTWFPASALTVVEPGAFYGHFNNDQLVPKLAERFPQGGDASVLCDRLPTPPTVWFPQNECGNSPTQPLLVPKVAQAGAWAGQILVGDVTHGGLHRVRLERIAGRWQGVVFRGSQGFACGVHRLAWTPDGALVVGGIGAGGNWNWKGTQQGLELARWTGRDAFEIADMRVTRDGFDLRFTRTIDRAWLAEPANFLLRSWRYEPTAAYGGPKIDERPVRVREAIPSADGMGVSIRCEGLLEGSCVHLRVDPLSTSGERIWSTDAWYTLHRLPGDRDGEGHEDGHAGMGAPQPANAMALVGRSADVHLVTRDDARVSRSDTRSQRELRELPGTLVLDATTGDRLTKTVHDGMRLHAEWRSADGRVALRVDDRVEFVADARSPSTPDAWHVLDAWIAPAADGASEVRFIIDGGAVETRRIERSAKPGPLAILARGVRTELRRVWIAPIEPIEPVATHARAWGPWETLTDEAATGTFVLRGGKAAFDGGENEIVGTSVPRSPNTFLTTTRTYRDFELLVDVLQHPELNSGIQIRSAVAGGFERREGHLVGLQVELDPSPRGYTAGIYDEARRGWLAPLTDAPYARVAYRRGEWNRIRILAEGSLVRTWINGIPASTLVDAMDLEGHIGLQVHGVGDREEPLQVRWRNLRVRERR